ncbi:MAG: hypothetical protein WBG62_17905, partial [Cyclobacteriaceae bacterium]
AARVSVADQMHARNAVGEMVYNMMAADPVGGAIMSGGRYLAGYASKSGAYGNMSLNSIIRIAESMSKYGGQWNSKKEFKGFISKTDAISNASNQIAKGLLNRGLMVSHGHLQKYVGDGLSYQLAYLFYNGDKIVHSLPYDGEMYLSEGEIPELPKISDITIKDIYDDLSNRFGPGSDVWNAVSNAGNGLGFITGGVSYSLGKKLDKILLYEFSEASYKSWKSNPAEVPSVRFGKLNLSAGAAKNIASGLKVGGTALGIVGMGMTGYEIYTGEKNLLGEGGLDLIMGGVAFIPGGGWLVSGAYFGGKALLEYTGNDIWNNP